MCGGTNVKRRAFWHEENVAQTAAIHKNKLVSIINNITCDGGGGEGVVGSAANFSLIFNTLHHFCFEQKCGAVALVKGSCSALER